MLEGEGHSMAIGDLTNDADIETLVRSLPALNGLVNCAGIIYPHPIKFITRANIDEAMSANFTSAERFLALGTPPSTVTVTGSLKFDLSIPEHLPQRAAELKATWQLHGRPIWVAASTHDGEDIIILEAFKLIQMAFPNALLLLVPRHPERFDKVAELIAKQGFSMARRSLKQAVSPSVAVFLGDSMGELLLWLALADVAFIGGSLVNVGGHNPLEPAALAVPIVTGLTMFNFQQITDTLMAAGALKQGSDSTSLARIVCDWLQHPEQKQKDGAAGLDVVLANRGALAKHLAIVDRLLKA